MSPIKAHFCPDCGHEVERWSNAYSPPIPLCDKCGREMVLVFGSPNLSFIGSGFYQNDYKKKEEPQKEDSPVE